MTEQGKIIANRILSFKEKNREESFEHYSTYIDEIEQAEKTDVWIVANPSAKTPLPTRYVNAFFVFIHYTPSFHKV